MTNNGLPATMSAVWLTGHGGTDKLEYRDDVPVPEPGRGEVLIRVAAASVNNTDINTRVGWYSKQVSSATSTVANNPDAMDTADATWSGMPMQFPRIQGADCCGRIVAVGPDVDESRIGERVLVRTMLRGYVDFQPFQCWTFGSECDGGFAQFAKAPAADTWAVDCDWQDTELAAIPCAYSTAEGMLVRAGVGPTDRVLVTGASGGVGSAAIQLAKCRRAEVLALTSPAKVERMQALGADHVVARDADLVASVGADSIDVVVDLVAGPQWPEFIGLLKRGGRYVTAGAIAGPLVELDMRTLYLKDLAFFGCAFQQDGVFDNVVQYIQQDRIRPHIAKVLPLAEIARAQDEFVAKKHVGKLVLEPP